VPVSNNTMYAADQCLRGRWDLSHGDLAVSQELLFCLGFANERLNGLKKHAAAAARSFSNDDLLWWFDEDIFWPVVAYLDI